MPQDPEFQAEYQLEPYRQEATSTADITYDSLSAAILRVRGVYGKDTLKRFKRLLIRPEAAHWLMRSLASEYAPLKSLVGYTLMGMEITPSTEVPDGCVILAGDVSTLMLRIADTSLHGSILDMILKEIAQTALEDMENEHLEDDGSPKLSGPVE